MQKQLNPNLFGKVNLPKATFQEFTEEYSSLKNEITKTNAVKSSAVLEQKIEQQQQLFQELQGHMTQVAFQSEENVKAVRARTERLQVALQQIERNFEALSMETSQKIHFMQQKNAEQKKLEDHVQNLLDRQNNLLKGYEVRMNQMQKILAEKESQLISTLALLNETKLELQKLKR